MDDQRPVPPGSGVRPPLPSSGDAPSGPWHLVGGCVVVGVGLLFGTLVDTDGADVAALVLGVLGGIWALVGVVAVGVRLGLEDFHGRREP